MIGPLRRQKSGNIIHETIRLEERTRYKSLLSQFTNTHLPEYSKSISPDKQSDSNTTSAENSVTSLSSWFGTGNINSKPVYVDLTDVDNVKPTLTKTSSGTGRRFFHELLSQSKQSPPPLR